MNLRIELVRLMKERTGLSLLRCKQLLELHGWDMEKAIQAAIDQTPMDGMDIGETGKRYWESH